MAEAGDGDFEVEVVGGEIVDVWERDCIYGMWFVEFCYLGGEHARGEGLGGRHGRRAWFVSADCFGTCYCPLIMLS